MIDKTEALALIRSAKTILESDGAERRIGSVIWRLADAAGVLLEQDGSDCMGGNTPTGRGFQVTKASK